jgi:uncharacterized membrane protein
MKQFLFSIAAGSGLVCGFFIVEVNRLWTANPQQAMASAVLAAFMFVTCCVLWKNFFETP